jgi:hypothetical protein
MGTVAVLSLLAYILTSVVHLTAAAPQQFEGILAMAATGGSNEPPQHGGSADLHCHGCIFASLSAPTQIVSTFMSRALPIWPPLCGIRGGLVAGVDPPPPKMRSQIAESA